MIDIKDIFPECDADTLLIELITQRGNANHNKGYSKVSKGLQKKSNLEGPFFGVIDSDKFENIDRDPYLPIFSQIVSDRINNDEKLRLKKIPNKKHYLIFIHPEFEPWIIAQGLNVGINLEDFEYNTYKEFEKESKSYGIVRSKRFKRFVNAVVQADPPGILLLKKWLIEKDF